MKKGHRSSFHFFFLLQVLLLVSCYSSYKPGVPQCSKDTVDSSFTSDSIIVGLIAPYKLHLDSQMNQVIGMTSSDLRKARPEGSLGNWMADVLRRSATEFMGKEVNIALLNHGGIRLPEIQKGPVTIGKIYELMPFENEMVILTLTGKDIDSLSRLIVSKGGDPVSGITITVKGNKEVECRIGGMPVVDSHEYLLATSDYLYNGGDNYSILKKAVRFIPANKKVRDVLIESFAVKPVLTYPQSEGRIVYE